jgi:hypothetical protein
MAGPPQPHTHHMFANEIADIVEQRIWSKIAKWLFINLGGLLTFMAVAIGAYFSLEARINNITAVDTLTARQLDAMAVEHAAIRSGLSTELRDIKSEIAEINRYLRDNKQSNTYSHSKQQP